MLQTPCMPFMQTNWTTSNFTQKADHSLSGTSSASQITVLPYIWDETTLCNSTDQGQLWVLVEGQLNSSLQWAPGAGKSSPVLGCLWAAHPADWGMCLFPSLWNLWGQIWCAVSRFGFPSTVKTLHMGDSAGGTWRRLQGGSTNQGYKYVKRVKNWICSV